MRLIFLFTQEKVGDPNSVYDRSMPSKNFFVSEDGIKSEGYTWLLHRMQKTGIVDEVTIFVESHRYPGHSSAYGMPIHVVPHINCVDQFVKKGDVVWVRGGFRTWHDWLIKKKGKHWLLLYAADTGRQKWEFWDIVFNDIGETNFIDRRGRLFVDFHKPINPNIFYPMFEQKPVYDVCIGASHIHDKKGQWKTVQAILAYKELYGINLKCVMPGRVMHGRNTNLIKNVIRDHGLDIEATGMVNRQKVNELYNKSKLFVYLGNGGQNDRGPIEALRCGTPVIICNPKRHHYFVSQNKAVSKVTRDGSDFEQVAHDIHHMLEKWNAHTRKVVHKYFYDNNGMTTKCIPEMKRIFDVVRVSAPSRKALEDIYAENTYGVY